MPVELPNNLLEVAVSQFRGCVVLGLLFFVSFGCSDPASPAAFPIIPATGAAENVVSAIEINGPSSVSLSVGSKIQLSANVKADQKSRRLSTISGAKVAWLSVDTHVASVDNTGLLTGKGNGATLVLAQSSGRTDSLVVSVGTGASPITFNVTGLALHVGDTAMVYRNSSRYPATWTSSNSSVAAVASTGKVTALLPGAIEIQVKDMVGATGTLSVLVTQGETTPTTPVTPPPPPPPTTPPPTGTGASMSIDLQLLRLDSGVGSGLVSSGIPMPEGVLFPAELPKAKLMVGGAEVQTYLEPLGRLYNDGSVRSLLLQAQVSISSQPLSAVLLLGTSGTSVRRTKVTVSWSVPTVVALPSSPDFLVSTNLVGPTVTSTSSGAAFSTYETRWSTGSDLQWNASGADWGGNYYDRALSTYALWVRTGDPKYWSRATGLAVDYRDKYLAPNNYMSSHHWSQLEGLALHYLLTGDERSRTAVGETTKILTAPQILNTISSWGWDHRIVARTILSLLSSRSIAANVPNLETLLPQVISSVLLMQRANGSLSMNANDEWFCGGQLNYMVALLHDAMVKYYQQVSPDARIKPFMKASLDYLWTQWFPHGTPNVGSGSFRYSTVVCSSPAGLNGTEAASDDLNLLFLTGFAWYYHETGDTQYLLRADEVFTEGMKSNAYIYNKQFNQTFYNSFNYISLRRR